MRIGIKEQAIVFRRGKSKCLTEAVVTTDPFNELGELGYERIDVSFLVVGIVGGYGTGRLAWRAQSGIVVAGQSEDEGDGDEEECAHRSEDVCREEGDLKRYELDT
jgi:hypothetical protein